MKGEEAKLLGLLREFWSVKNELKPMHFCLRSLELDAYHTRHWDGDISDNHAIKSFDRK